MNWQAWWWPVAAAPFVGSFLGVIIVRVEAPQGILWGRSRCEACGTALGTADLVPLASFLALRGRCRHCGARLSLFYPAIELAALGVAAWAAVVADGWLVLASAALGWALLALALIDWRHFLLPDFLTLPLIPAGLFVAWALDAAELRENAIGAAAGFLLVVAIRLAYWRLRGREGMGLGDAKLLAAAGAWVGWVGLPSVILIASLAALAIVLIRQLRGERPSLHDRVPFGTYLALATWLVWLYGPLG